MSSQLLLGDRVETWSERQSAGELAMRQIIKGQIGVTIWTLYTSIG
jgi:hypothetical protein